MALKPALSRLRLPYCEHSHSNLARLLVDHSINTSDRTGLWLEKA